jgi:predicted nucleic-acid-binding Zn-ribbon protein
MNSPNKCPVCGSKEYVTISISSSAEYASLIYISHGGARLQACVDCGNVYINETDRRYIQKSIKKRKA